MDRRDDHSKSQSWSQSPLGFLQEGAGQLLTGTHARVLPSPGAVTGRIATVGNISAEEGGSVTLQCHLSSTTATVTQVDWKQQDQFLAIHHAESGWSIYPAFRERVVPRPNLGLTLQSLTTNDTGVYSCVYHTFPDGIYRGRFFLEVLRSSGMPSGAERRPSLILRIENASLPHTVEEGHPTCSHSHPLGLLNNVGVSAHPRTIQ